MKESEFFQDRCPGKKELLSAKHRISGYIHRTPLIKSETLSAMCGCELVFKMENLQKAGAFKSRGASNAVITLIENAYRGVVATHSSGNHAQALARVASRYGLIPKIVMPSDSPAVKVEAVKSYGGQITFCEPTLQARESALREVMKKHGGIEIHPYDNYSIIAGQSTCASEIIEDFGTDFIVAPVGGGGLLAGTALAADLFGNKIRVIGAEPANVNDAFASMQKGEIARPSMQPTIADGLRTYLGERNFQIIWQKVDDIITVNENEISEAMYLFWERTKFIIEPSSAVALAAVLSKREQFGGKRVSIIISGGNVDLKNLPWIKKAV